jgi:ParB/RepB/Spo0J family partition protein
VSAAHQLEIDHIPLGDIRPSPSNPRKTFKGLEALAEDLKLRGILQPLRVRPVDSGYEIVFGERRWRAAGLAKLKAAPCIVEEMSDAAALELMLVELAQTEDVHPVEEAEAYRELHEKHGLSIEDIAARVGKSKGTVYARLKLCSLPEAARAAALSGDLPASHALLIARIPGAERQAEATKGILAGYGDGCMSFREAADFVQEKFMLRLENAPFGLTEKLTDAGPCSTCAMRTGNQVELFSDVKSADVCTKPDCYEEKVQAVWQLKVKKAEKAGQKVLTEEEAAKTFNDYGVKYGSGFRSLDEEEWIGGETKTVADLLPKKVPTVLARNPKTGEIVELVDEQLVKKAVEKLRPAAPKPSPEKVAETKEWERKAAESARRSAERVVLLDAVVDAIEEEAPSPDLWRILARAALGHYDADEVVQRRGWLEHDANSEEQVAALQKTVSNLSVSQARGVIAEVALTIMTPGYDESDPVFAAAKLLKLDAKKALAKQEKAKAEKEKAEAKSRCSMPGCKEKKAGFTAHCEAHGVGPDGKQAGPKKAAPTKKKAKK